MDTFLVCLICVCLPSVMSIVLHELVLQIEREDE